MDGAEGGVGGGESGAAAGEGGRVKVKRKRKRKTFFQLEVLEKTYAGEQWPSEELRGELSKQLGLSDQQLQKWFWRRRNKEKKPQPRKRWKKVERVLVSSDSESEERENIKPSSSIDPPMPSESVKEWNGKHKRNKKQVIPFAGGRMGRHARSVEADENLVGKRIKVWWAVDNRYYEGVVKSFDCNIMKHKVSYDDGDEEILELKGERWELVENVSPISDSVGVAVHEQVSSSQSDMICVQGYKVKNINAPILKAIFKSHGDIAAKCVFTNAAVRASLLEAVCEVVGRIKTNDVTNIISKLEEIESQVSAAEASKINVSWLQAHLETIRKRNDAQKKVTSLMEMKTNTILAKRAAKIDLKDKYDNLVVAHNQLEEAKRCVKVLDLVEKKLSNDVLEFKAERDLFVGQPILYVD